MDGSDCQRAISSRATSVALLKIPESVSQKVHFGGPRLSQEPLPGEVKMLLIEQQPCRGFVTSSRPPQAIEPILIGGSMGPEHVMQFPFELTRLTVDQRISLQEVVESRRDLGSRGVLASSTRRNAWSRGRSSDEMGTSPDHLYLFLLIQLRVADAKVGEGQGQEG